jgi:prepilin-type N-terminal cleavage/methylation domain-containing protein/prepilin-type processing-associated H-X9-DG protein
MSSGSTRRRTRRPPLAFTLIELLVVLSVIALLVAILLPALAAARKAAQAVACGSNLRQLSIAQIAYAEIFRRFPISYYRDANDNQNWKGSLAKHMGWKHSLSPAGHPASVSNPSRTFFRCPSITGPGEANYLTCSYGMSNNFTRFYYYVGGTSYGGITDLTDKRLGSPLTHKRMLVLMFDGSYQPNAGEAPGPDNVNPVNSSTMIDFVRHGGKWSAAPIGSSGTGPVAVSGGGVNVAFTDGHVITTQPGAYPLRSRIATGGIKLADYALWDMRE